MTLVPVHNNRCEAADSLPDLARRRPHCLAHSWQLAELTVDNDLQPVFDLLERKVVTIDPDTWRDTGLAGNLMHVLGVDDLRDSFLTTEERVLLERRTPIPLVSRPVTQVFPDATPHHAALTYPLGDTMRVEPDYSRRARIDERTSTSEGRQPRIATRSQGLQRALLRPRADVHARQMRAG